MKLWKLIVFSLLGVTVACSKKEALTGSQVQGPTPVTSAAKASGATAAMIQAISLATRAAASLGSVAGSNPLFRAAPFQPAAATNDVRFEQLKGAQLRALSLPRAKLADVLAKAQRRAQAAVPLTTDPCADGGTVTYSGTQDDVTGAFSLTMTFSSCREDDQQATGSSTATGAYSPSGTGPETFSMRLGNGDGIVQSTDFTVLMFTGGYANLYGRYSVDMTLTGSFACVDLTCAAQQTSLTATGKQVFDDFFSQSSLDYQRLAVTGTEDASSTAMTMTGTVTERWSTGAGPTAVQHSASVSFIDFHDAVTTTGSYRDEEIDGTLSTRASPIGGCFSGTFVVATTAPIRTDTTTGATVSGEVTLNDNVTITFNPDGTVTVTRTGEAPATHASAAALESICPMEDMGPLDSTPTLVDPGVAVTASGSSMLATLSWFGTGCPSTGCTSDMDLHLAHYASAYPTSLTLPDWHVYYAAKTDGGVATLDYDDVEGDGPEHITMGTFPDGYYVLYVDPYSMDQDASATIMVALAIGTEVYLFPTFQFTSSSVPDHRICDLRVASGAVTILPADLSITAPAQALRASKLR